MAKGSNSLFCAYGVCDLWRNCYSGLARFGSNSRNGKSSGPWQHGDSLSFNSVVAPQIVLARAHPAKPGKWRCKDPEPKAAAGVESWSNGDPQVFRLRRGPNYHRNGRKELAGPALYRCVGMDVVQAPEQIHSAISCLANEVRTSGVKASCPLPQVIVVNFQMPFQVGYMVGEHPPEDCGTSILFFFRIEPSTVEQAKNMETASAGIKLLAKYLREDHPKEEGNNISGCFKAVGFLENVDDLDIPSVVRPVVHKFNGKPVLIERETRMYGGVGSAGTELVELAVDVRGFNFVARTCLYRLREQLRFASVQVGLLIQGCKNIEMPEELLGAVSFNKLDLLGGRCVKFDPKGPDDNAGRRVEDQQGSSGALAMLGRMSIGMRCARRHRPAPTPLVAPPVCSTPPREQDNNDDADDAIWHTPRSMPATPRHFDH